MGWQVRLPPYVRSRWGLDSLASEFRMISEGGKMDWKTACFCMRAELQHHEARVRDHAGEQQRRGGPARGCRHPQDALQRARSMLSFPAQIACSLSFCPLIPRRIASQVFGLVTEVAVIPDWQGTLPLGCTVVCTGKCGCHGGEGPMLRVCALSCAAVREDRGTAGEVCGRDHRRHRHRGPR